jgi:beta-N-acetylhexosaminidase
VSRFGAVILGADGLRLTAEEKALYRDSNPFGFILFARNIDTPDQIRALTVEMREAVGWAAPITIDQEGGRVQRLWAPMARNWLPPREHVLQAGAGAERAIYLRYRIIAHELHTLGIDSNCVPCADIAVPETHPFLANRCFDTDADTVIRLSRAAAQAHLDGGVLPVLKHMPGHGRAVVDSHYDLPRTDAPLEELTRTDFAPFHALRDLPLGMTGHVVYDALDADLPATLSPLVMRHMREAIGFDGLIMTDDIGMKALSGSITDLSQASLDAGCDVILHCNGTFADRQAAAEAAGEMSDAAQARADAAVAARHRPDDIDIAALDAELSTLMKGRVYV